MKANWVFWKLECKKYIKLIPLILLESMIFGLILLVFGVYVSRSLYGERRMGVIQIGVVSEEESALSAMLVNFVSSMESMEDNCHFVTMERAEAYEALSEGSIYAAVILPQGMVEGILNGTNLPATVVFGRTYGKVETEVFKELAGAGDRLLSTAQAGIYAADALCMQMGRFEKMQEAEEVLNAAYLEYALRRADCFDLREVIATGGMNTQGYYVVSLLLIFLSFAGIIMGRYARVSAGDFGHLVCIRGIGILSQYFLESLAFSSIFATLGTVLAIPVLQWYLVSEGHRWIKPAGALMLFLVFMVMGSFVRLVVEVTGNSSGGLGAALLILAVLMVVSGLFLPSAFLPAWMTWIGQRSPYTLWMETMWGILGRRFPENMVLWLLCTAISGLVIGMAVYMLRSLQRNER